MALIHIVKEAQEEDRLIVTYDSVRSNGNKTRSGLVERAETEPDAFITFRRNDGQLMKATEDGGLLSVGSTHPFTGSIVDVKVDEA